jgi:hypothetical protein
LLVDQRIKLSLGIFWMLNLVLIHLVNYYIWILTFENVTFLLFWQTRLMLWYIFELDSRPQTTTDSVHWCVLSFCSTPNVIIIQVCSLFFDKSNFDCNLINFFSLYRLHWRLRYFAWNSTFQCSDFPSLW